MNKPMDERTFAAFDRFDHVLLRAMGPKLRACVPAIDGGPEVRERFTECMTRLMQPMLVHGSQENPEDLSVELQERAFLLLQNQALLRRAVEAEMQIRKMTQILEGQLPPELQDLAVRLAKEMSVTRGKQDS